LTGILCRCFHAAAKNAGFFILRRRRKVVAPVSAQKNRPRTIKAPRRGFQAAAWGFVFLMSVEK